jgi:hypothetical protein
MSRYSIEIKQNTKVTSGKEDVLAVALALVVVHIGVSYLCLQIAVQKMDTKSLYEKGASLNLCFMSKKIS